jgi:hypothetical protein
LFLVACSNQHDVRAVYPGGGLEAGALDVVLNVPTAGLTVSIGDKIVVDRESTRRAHIDGVPAGPAHVRVATAGKCEQHTLGEFDVAIPPSGVATLALPGPAEDQGCGIFAGLMYIGMGVEAIALVAVTEASRQAHSMSHIK